MTENNVTETNFGNIPLPEPDVPLVRGGCYTGDQMRAAILAERQRFERVDRIALLQCEIQPRPLSYSLRDYHHAPSDGPLHFQWTDKPHRLLYDLIAAVQFYAVKE